MTYTLAQLRDGTGFAPGARFEGYEDYNGWKNRETWAVNLWLSNDQGLDEMTRERVAVTIELESENWLRDGVNPPPIRVYAADAIKEFVDELLDPNEELIDAETRHAMSSDCGSLWRVDWLEIAEHYMPEKEEA